LKWATALLG